MRMIVDPETSLEFEVPDFATDAQAFERGRRLARGEIATLRLQPDYGAVVPLWSDDGPALDLFRALPPDLADELSAWQSMWASHHIFPHGWSSHDARDEWSGAGERLFARLTEDLWNEYTIQPVFRRMAWPRNA